MRLQAKITMQCMQCGKTVYKGDSYYSPMTRGNMFKDLTGLGGGTEVYCSKGCMNQATGGGGAARGGAGSGKISASKAKEDARAAESNERHKSALQAVKDYQFDETDEDGFVRSTALFFSDYTSCHPGLISDNDYKKAYIARAEQELKVLKAGNSVFAEKFQSLYKEAKMEMNNKVKKRIIISLIIFGSVTVIGLLAGLINGITKGTLGDSFSIGAMSGIMAGALLAALSQMGFVSNTKTGNE